MRRERAFGGGGGEGLHKEKFLTKNFYFIIDFNNSIITYQKERKAGVPLVAQQK